jgi:hypothetical protein
MHAYLLHINSILPGILPRILDSRRTRPAAVSIITAGSSKPTLRSTGYTRRAPIIACAQPTWPCSQEGRPAMPWPLVPTTQQ